MWVYLVAIVTVLCFAVLVLLTVGALKSNPTSFIPALDRLVIAIAVLTVVAFPAYLAEEYPETRESVAKGWEYTIYTAVGLVIFWFVLRIGLPLIFSRGQTTNKPPTNTEKKDKA